MRNGSETVKILPHWAKKKMGYPSKSMLRWRGTILIFKTRFEAGM